MIPISYPQKRILYGSVSDFSRLLSCLYRKRSGKIFGAVGPVLKEHTGCKRVHTIHFNPGTPAPVACVHMADKRGGVLKKDS